MKSETTDDLIHTLGPAAGDLIDSGDAIDDREGRRVFLELYTERHVIELEGHEGAILYVGDAEWPFPIPAMKHGETWFLDTEAGREELIDRRVGRNELALLNVCLAVVDAQAEYASQDWNGDGVHTYAQRFRSTEGMRDGLYWPTVDGQAASPCGELIADAGQARERADGTIAPYHGYLFRLLTSQGVHANDGAYDYMAGDLMIGGFAIIAYPASYGSSGVMSFMVSHDGVVYEKDLGLHGADIVGSMTAFDPDESWSVALQE